MKLLKPAAVLEEFERLGYGEHLALWIGVLEISCAVIYLIPRTAVLGAILVTAYLGGATATHVRIGDPFIGPVNVGVFVWIGLLLRDGRLRGLLPLSSGGAPDAHRAGPAIFGRQGHLQGAKDHFVALVRFWSAKRAPPL